MGSAARGVATGGFEMTQPPLNAERAPGLAGAPERSPSRAAEAASCERTQARMAGEVHVWFAAPSASSRYLDIVLAGRAKLAPS